MAPRHRRDRGRASPRRDGDSTKTEPPAPAARPRPRARCRTKKPARPPRLGSLGSAASASGPSRPSHDTARTQADDSPGVAGGVTQAASGHRNLACVLGDRSAAAPDRKGVRVAISRRSQSVMERPRPAARPRRRWDRDATATLRRLLSRKPVRAATLRAAAARLCGAVHSHISLEVSARAAGRGRRTCALPRARNRAAPRRLKHRRPRPARRRTARRRRPVVFLRCRQHSASPAACSENRGLLTWSRAIRCVRWSTASVGALSATRRSAVALLGG